VEDFVQEMYLRLNKYVKNPDKIMYNETDVNKFYVYITIKNLYNDYLKDKSKYHMVRLDDIDFVYEIVETTPEAQKKSEIQRQKAEEKLIDMIQQEVNGWDRWYDQKLFKVYYETDISMRKLSKDTNISVTSIFNSCKNYKQILNTKFAEDFQDYINGDFHLIKNNKDE
jgi:DNA-directed RNA polymerase specialized sigma24 family protein